MAANDNSSGGGRSFPSAYSPMTWIAAGGVYFAARAGLLDPFLAPLLGGLG